MLLRNGKRKLDAYRPTFDPGLDVATLVFSHVQCVKTRHSLARVSRIWRDQDCRGVPSQVRHYRARSSYETSGVEKPSLYQYASGVENAS